MGKKADMEQFSFWLDKYTPYFKGMDNNELRLCWWLYSRDSENDAPPREMAAWSAVNAEMQERGL